MPLWSFWIDRGGTFTDLIALDPDGVEHTLKLPSLAATYSDAAVEGMRRILAVSPGEPFPAHRVASIKLGTTVATNALLERKGAPTLFVNICGFDLSVVIGVV